MGDVMTLRMASSSTLPVGAYLIMGTGRWGGQQLGNNSSNNNDEDDDDDDSGPEAGVGGSVWVGAGATPNQWA